MSSSADTPEIVLESGDPGAEIDGSEESGGADMESEVTIASEGCLAEWRRKKDIVLWSFESVVPKI